MHDSNLKIITGQIRVKYVNPCPQPHMKILYPRSVFNMGMAANFLYSPYKGKFSLIPFPISVGKILHTFLLTSYLHIYNHSKLLRLIQYIKV